MRRGFNERKAEVLDLLEGGGKATASDVARELGITLVNASRLMGLYYREGLLERHTVDISGRKSYAITGKGRERLLWILGESLR